MFIQNINPVFLKFGPIKIHWYGIAYLCGFIAGYFIMRYRFAKEGVKNIDVDNLLFYLVLGVIIGGRLGEVLFYRPAFYFSHPLQIFAVWKGGMASHGGVIGVVFALILFAKRYKFSLFKLADVIAVATPPGLCFGRMANFINSELVGKATHVWWAVVFQRVDNLPRHPVQLYQAATNGIILFLIMWFFPYKKFPEGTRVSVFLIAYGIMRFFTEYFRKVQPGYLGYYLDMTTGQMLSLVMIVAGLVIYFIQQQRAFK